MFDERESRETTQGRGRQIGRSSPTGVTQARTVNAVNQYTAISLNGQPVTPALQHDAAGNMTLDPSAWDLGSGPEGLEFEYDEENRLTAVKRGSNHNVLMTIAYDALGRRVETVEYWDAATNAAFATPKHVRHVYDGLQTIEEHVCDSGVTEGECDSPGWALARAFIWGDSSRFPEPVAMIDCTGVGLNVSNTCGTGATTQPAEACDSGTPTTGCVYHYLHDALGSVIGLTDCGGKLVERYTYDPYGKTYVEHWDPAASGGAGAWVANGGELIPDGGGATTPAYSAFGNPFMWTGQRYDAAVSLYHFHFRTYSPTLGRWLQRDPAGYVDGLNLYEYVRSNSTGQLDPLGLQMVRTVPARPYPPRPITVEPSGPGTAAGTAVLLEEATRDYRGRFIQPARRRWHGRSQLHASLVPPDNLNAQADPIGASLRKVVEDLQESLDENKKKCLENGDNNACSWTYRLRHALARARRNLCYHQCRNKYPESEEEKGSREIGGSGPCPPVKPNTPISLPPSYIMYDDCRRACDENIRP